ncbi:hypothetical protein GCM10018965_064980 [Nonomuraea roseola]
MVNTRPDQLVYQERLLTALRDELRARTIPAVLVIAEGGRPGLDVVDSRFRTRRVFVHLAFCWFYWGDQQDERVTCLRLLPPLSAWRKSSRTAGTRASKERSASTSARSPTLIVPDAVSMREDRLAGLLPDRRCASGAHHRGRVPDGHAAV